MTFNKRWVPESLWGCSSSKTRASQCLIIYTCFRKGDWSLKKGRKCRRSEVELGVVDSPTARPKRLKWEEGIQGQLGHTMRNWGRTHTHIHTRMHTTHTHTHTPPIHKKLWVGHGGPRLYFQHLGGRGKSISP